MRLGTTSCIWHDYMLPNVERLAPLRRRRRAAPVRRRARRARAPRTCSQMVRLKHEHALSPTRCTRRSTPASPPPTRRAARAASTKCAAPSTGRAPLAPLAHTVHVYLGDGERDARAAGGSRRLARPRPPLARGHPRRRAAARPRASSASTTTSRSSPPSCARSISRSRSTSATSCATAARCAPLVDEWLPRARVLQLHGTRPDGRDHKSLAYAPRSEIEWLLRTLGERQFGGVLTLEVFDADDLEASLALVRSLAS